ncbi:24826_t:CDS:2 [Cetraspora pellucida]|uniref:24826_t:CDS:1 n=1 Tax=Cetraspora pellucida TaxID=1433469 RepID=A0A9N9AMY3_9GLOM|nr:24826_t:CDS:2 [Cetraspora pellucida]
MKLFSVGVSENTSHAISSYKSSGGYYAYAKPTDEHKRKALENVLNKLITNTSSNRIMQDFINYFEPDNHENSSFEDNRNSSDVDLNNSVQNKHKFYEMFYIAKEVLKNNSYKKSLTTDENK